MFSKSTLIALSLLAVAVTGQQVGKLETETHPKLTWQRCTAPGSCSNVAGSVVLDSNWRWLHNNEGYANCYDGASWVDEYCTDPVECAANCALEGANYQGTYGITAGGTSLTHKFVTEGEFSTNIGSRVYLMDSSDTKYEMFKLLNKEFTFDVDVSKLPCGLNGALYFSEMDSDGGQSKYPGNKAGAKYGTGYCDAQCPHDIKFINGEANLLDWNESETDPSAGSGKHGTCCQEMDIWEANSISTAFTPHPCSVTSQTRCEGAECGDADNRYGGVCDKDGCDFNSYRLGDTAFYGPGKLVDTGSKFTVVTQFITEGNSDTGDLIEIRRIYKQNGKVIQNSQINIDGITPGNAITDAFCDEGKTAFGDNNHHNQLGGLKRIAEGFKTGVVLVMSIWDDHAAHMLWLDSAYPLDKDPSEPGVSRGTCSRDSGDPKDVEANHPDAQVTFSNIKFGPIDSTY